MSDKTMEALTEALLKVEERLEILNIHLEDLKAPLQMLSAQAKAEGNGPYQ